MLLTLTPPKHPAVLLIDHSANDAGDGDVVAIALEALLRYALGAYPSLALLVVQSFYGLVADSAHANPVRDAYAAVTAYYGVAYLRYDAVVRNGAIAWPGCFDPGLPARACSVHPPWKTHDLIADVVAESILSLSSSSADASHTPQAPGAPFSPSLAASRDVEYYAPCVTPLSHHSGATPPVFSVARGNWSLYEDRPGKLGIISEEPGSTVQFSLQFGAQPRAMLAFLKGYDPNLGEVTVSMTAVRVSEAQANTSLAQRKAWVGRSFGLDARRHDGLNISQTTVAVIDASNHLLAGNYMAGPGRRAFSRDFLGILGFGIPPHSTAELRVTLMCGTRRTCKFKIISVTSC